VKLSTPSRDAVQCVAKWFLARFQCFSNGLPRFDASIQHQSTMRAGTTLTVCLEKAIDTLLISAWPRVASLSVGLELKFGSRDIGQIWGNRVYAFCLSISLPFVHLQSSTCLSSNTPAFQPVGADQGRDAAANSNRIFDTILVLRYMLNIPRTVFRSSSYI
jgi:hypothetical protein